MVSMPEKVKNPTQGLNVEARPKQSTTRMDVPVPHSCGRRKLSKGPVEFVKYTSVAQVCLTYGIVGGTLQWYVVFSKFSC